MLIGKYMIAFLLGAAATAIFVFVFKAFIFPSTFFIKVFNDTDCNLESIHLITDQHSISFDTAQMEHSGGQSFEASAIIPSHSGAE